MATIAVSDIETRARQKADLVNSNFISAAEILAYVNEAFFNFYDLITHSFEDYNLTGPTSFSISSGANTYTLPADFYKLVGVDRSLGGGDYYALDRYSWSRRNRYSRSNYYNGTRVNRLMYRITGSDLRVLPEQDAPGDYQLWYIPLATALTSTSDTIERYNGFEELIVIDTAIKMLSKEESDVSLLLMERQKQEKRLQKMLIDRDIASSDRIEDAYEEYDYWDEFYL
jgi:hypothetical protein